MNSYQKQFWSFFALGVLFNFVFIFFTLEGTYDALIHLFFSDHYRQNWFNPWEERWYTGFNVMTYPPLVHQLMALISMIAGLRGALFITAMIAILLFISGVYRFSITIIENKEVALYAMLFASFSTVFIETLHIFGQLPTIFGISLLFHSFPFLNSYLKKGKSKDLALAMAILTATVCSHHVTPIFGMVFFIAPLFGKAIMDEALKSKPDFKGNRNFKSFHYQKLKIRQFVDAFKKLFKRILFSGISILFVIVFAILPYWLTSKNDPISQVPIPHGSRSNFFVDVSSGLMFFIIPWGIALFFIPYIVYRLFHKKYLFFGISFLLLFLLGTGGTTPIPRFLLGEKAFNILTFDRFTFWACMLSYPFSGELLYRSLKGDIHNWAIRRHRIKKFRIILGAFAIMGIVMIVFTTDLSTFRSLQPKKINPEPVVNFLQQDQHYKWRYLTLGLGDQMSYLSTLTKAKMVDGNYHSARKLPELTTKAVERLENSKFNGVEGLGSLQQMLTNSNKYHLKFIFSNDKFYDPLLFYYGWNKLAQLENGIWVWEKNGVQPLPQLSQAKNFSAYQRIMWGFIPMFSIYLIIILLLIYGLKPDFFNKEDTIFTERNFTKISDLLKASLIWTSILIIIAIVYGIDIWKKNYPFSSAENVVVSYYNELDFKQFKDAYELINPENDKSYDQFLLEFLVSDGLLNSYGKLQDINTEIIFDSPKRKEIAVATKWVTPLKSIYLNDTIETIKTRGKWYINPKPFVYSVPQDLMYSKNIVDFYSTGKRKVTMEDSPHKDVINSPEIQFLSANLVSYQGNYSVVGEIVNYDNFPSFVSVTAELYDKSSELIARYDVQDLMKHHLMPKEKTSFKIDFQAIAWLNNKIIKDPSFNPEFIEEFKFKKQPANVILHCTAVHSPTTNYNDVQIYNLEQNASGFKAGLYNSGIEEVTITQILSSYYNADNQLIWVCANYTENALKPQRKSDEFFQCGIPKGLNIKQNVLDNCYVNGVKSARRPFAPIENKNWNEDGKYFYDFTLNNFIGNE